MSIASSSSQVPLASMLATVFDRPGKVFDNTIFCKNILALGHGAEEGNSRLERCWFVLDWAGAEGARVAPGRAGLHGPGHSRRAKRQSPPQVEALLDSGLHARQRTNQAHWFGEGDHS